MIWILKVHIAGGELSIRKFEEECEGLFSVIYFGIVHWRDHHLNIKHTVECFLEKWFDGYNTCDLNELVLLQINEDYQMSSFGSVILLFNHLNFTLLSDVAIQILNWKSQKDVSVPQWLKEITSCSEKTYKNLNTILFISLYWNKDVSYEREILEEGCYLQSLALFFKACYYYTSRKYTKSIDILSSISDTNCFSYLLAWRELLIGLNLEHLDKKQSALLKYRSAVNICSSEICYGLYYASRIFRSMKDSQAELECLNILSSVEFNVSPKETSIQVTLLKHHLPKVTKCHSRILWLLALTYISQELWLEACETLQKLVNDWDNNASVEGERTTLLLPCDQLPSLSSRESVILSLACSHMGMKNYEFEHIFNTRERGDLGHLENSSLSEDSLLRGICRLVVAESFYRREKYKESLTECSRVLIWIESLHSEKWMRVILLTKVYLYKMLSILHSKSSNKMTENSSSRFERLYNHCLSLYKAEVKSLGKEVGNNIVDPTSFTDIVHFLVKVRLREFDIILN